MTEKNKEVQYISLMHFGDLQALKGSSSARLLDNFLYSFLNMPLALDIFALTSG